METRTPFFFVRRVFENWKAKTDSHFYIQKQYSHTMAFTCKQSAGVSFSWTELHFMVMEPRPVHKPVMKGAHDFVEVRTDDGTIFQWYPNGEVTRKKITGELTTWWPVPTIDEIVHRREDGVFCRFYSDGRVTMARDGLTWLWGPPVLGEFTEGNTHILPCTCPECVDDHIDECCDRFRYSD